MGWQASPDGPFSLETDRLVFEGESVASLDPAKTGEVSRVIVSDLLNDTTPLLRYDIGDLATMGTPMPFAASCYGSIEELRGKSNDSICDASGRRIEPFALLGCLKETLGAAQYRLICVERGLLVLQYRPARNARDPDRRGPRGPARDRRRADQDRRPEGARDKAGEFRKAEADHRPQHHRRRGAANASCDDLHLTELPSVAAS